MFFQRRLAAALAMACLVAVPRLTAADESHPYGRTPLTQREKVRWSVLMRDGKKLVDGERWLEASEKSDSRTRSGDSRSRD